MRCGETYESLKKYYEEGDNPFYKFCVQGLIDLFSKPDRITTEEFHKLLKIRAYEHSTKRPKLKPYRRNYEKVSGYCNNYYSKLPKEENPLKQLKKPNELKPTVNVALTHDNYLKGIKEFSLGYGHSLALMKDGKIYSWGWNERGQLGLSDKEDRLSPSLVTALEDKSITKLSTQDFDKHHSLAMDSEGRVYSWGQNNHGQLGLGDKEDRLSPEEIEFFSDKSIIQISLGKFHSLALDNEGQVYSWGWNEGGQLGLEDKKDKFEPSLIPYFKENGIFITQVITAYKHNLALDKNGKVYSWGWNEYGQLGLSHNEERLSPNLISYFKDNGIIISVGQRVISGERMVVKWGVVSSKNRIVVLLD